VKERVSGEKWIEAWERWGKGEIEKRYRTQRNKGKSKTNNIGKSMLFKQVEGKLKLEGNKQHDKRLRGIKESTHNTALELLN
jgi:hypothetical protein